MVTKTDICPDFLPAKGFYLPFCKSVYANKTSQGYCCFCRWTKC